jgi:hypothetical protein
VLLEPATEVGDRRGLARGVEALRRDQETRQALVVPLDRERANGPLDRTALRRSDDREPSCYNPSMRDGLLTSQQPSVDGSFGC